MAHKKKLSQPSESRRPLWIVIAWGVFFTLAFARILWIESDGIHVGEEAVWSDWPLHMSMAEIFATKPASLWFAYHPIYAMGKFTYPFLANIFPGMMMRAGLPLVESMLVTSVVLSWLLLAGMHRLFTLLLGSAGRSALAMSIFFLAGGLGFVDYFWDLGSAFSFDKLFYPYKYFSEIPGADWARSSFISAHLVPQRALLFGMTLGVWASYLVLSALIEGGSSKRKKLLLASLLTGILPIAHAHTLIALFMLLGCALVTCLKQKWRDILIFAAPALALSVLLYWKFVHGGIETDSFMSFYPGYSSHGFLEWVRFWFIAWGLALPVGLLGFTVLQRAQVLPIIRGFFVGAFVCFIAANIIKFQPTVWDNTKIFIWAYLGLAGLCSLVISSLWREPKRAPRVGAALLLIVS